MSKGKYAESAQALVGKAFKMAFAKDRSLKKRMRAACCVLYRVRLSSRPAAQPLRRVIQRPSPRRRSLNADPVTPPSMPRQTAQTLGAGANKVLFPAEARPGPQASCRQLRQLRWLQVRGRGGGRARAKSDSKVWVQPTPDWEWRRATTLLWLLSKTMMMTVRLGTLALLTCLLAWSLLMHACLAAVVIDDDGSLGDDFLRNAPWYQEGASVHHMPTHHVVLHGRRYLPEQRPHTLCVQACRGRWPWS